MKKIQFRKFLALLLALTLAVGLFPATPALAAGSGTVSIAGKSYGTDLQRAYNEANNGDTISISGNIELEAGLKFGERKDITLQGSNSARISIAQGSEKNFSTSDGSEGKSSSLLIIGNEKGAAIHFGRVVLDGITFDAQQACRCVRISGTPESTFDITNCIFQNAYMTQGGGGGGLQIVGGTLGSIGGGSIIQNNTADTSYTSGGGMYVSSLSQVCLDDVTLQGNEAHSGGGLYVYNAGVYCTEKTKFLNNTANQRGGAIHDHGYVMLAGSTVTGNRSKQHGGGVYVSADGMVNGSLLLGDATLAAASGMFGDNTSTQGITISDNKADNAGGGIYIASQGMVSMGGNTTITNNSIYDETDSEGRPLYSNLYVATAASWAVAYADLTGTVGVSTSNPYTHKERQGDGSFVLSKSKIS